MINLGTVECALCGKVIRKTGVRTRYCEKCRRIRNRQTRVERWIKKRAAVKKELRAGIVEIMKQADAAGMTYGKYVAKMEGDDGVRKTT